MNACLILNYSLTMLHRKLQDWRQYITQLKTHSYGNADFFQAFKEVRGMVFYTDSPVFYYSL